MNERKLHSLLFTPSSSLPPLYSLLFTPSSSLPPLHSLLFTPSSSPPPHLRSAVVLLHQRRHGGARHDVAGPVGGAAGGLQQLGAGPHQLQVRLTQVGFAVWNHITPPVGTIQARPLAARYGGGSLFKERVRLGLKTLKYSVPFMQVH